MDLRPPLNIDITRLAIFLDVDGTLAEIAAKPSHVKVSAKTKAILEVLRNSTDGAIAIVTGRSLDEIDELLHPLRLPVASVHGAVVRYSDDSIREITLPQGTIERIAKGAQTAIRGHPGIVIEEKRAALAIHFRACPDLGPTCIAVARRLADENEGFICQGGKMIVEIVPENISKGGAIRNFLGAHPFKGRRPVFAGDDITDESGFTAVNESQGISIKIGGGTTNARYLLDNPASLHEWLHRLSDRNAERGPADA